MGQEALGSLDHREIPLRIHRSQAHKQERNLCPETVHLSRWRTEQLVLVPLQTLARLGPVQDRAGKAQAILAHKHNRRRSTLTTNNSKDMPIRADIRHNTLARSPHTEPEACLSQWLAEVSIASVASIPTVLSGNFMRRCHVFLLSSFLHNMSSHFAYLICFFLTTDGSYRYGSADGYDNLHALPGAREHSSGRGGSYHSDWYGLNNSRGFSEGSSADWDGMNNRGYNDATWSGEKYAERESYYHHSGHYPADAYNNNSTYRSGVRTGANPNVGAVPLARGVTTGAAVPNYNASAAGWAGKYDGSYRSEDVPPNTDKAKLTTTVPSLPVPTAASSASVAALPKPPLPVVKPVPPPPPPGGLTKTSPASAPVPPRVAGASTALGPSVASYGASVCIDGANISNSDPSKDPIRLKRAFSDGATPAEPVSGRPDYVKSEEGHFAKKSKFDVPSSSHSSAHLDKPRKDSFGGSHQSSHKKPVVEVKPPPVAAPAPVVTTSLFETLSKFKSSAPNLSTTTTTSTGVYTGITGGLTGALSIETPVAGGSVGLPSSGLGSAYKGLSTPSVNPAGGLSTPVVVGEGATPVSAAAAIGAIDESKRPRIAWGQGTILFCFDMAVQNDHCFLTRLLIFLVLAGLIRKSSASVNPTPTVVVKTENEAAQSVTSAGAYAAESASMAANIYSSDAAANGASPMRAHPSSTSRSPMKPSSTADASQLPMSPMATTATGSADCVKPVRERQDSYAERLSSKDVKIEPKDSSTTAGSSVKDRDKDTNWDRDKDSLKDKKQKSKKSSADKFISLPSTQAAASSDSASATSVAGASKTVKPSYEETCLEFEKEISTKAKARKDEKLSGSQQTSSSASKKDSSAVSTSAPETAAVVAGLSEKRSEDNLKSLDKKKKTKDRDRDRDRTPRETKELAPATVKASAVSKDSEDEEEMWNEALNIDVAAAQSVPVADSGSDSDAVVTSVKKRSKTSHASPVKKSNRDRDATHQSPRRGTVDLAAPAATTAAEEPVVPAESEVVEAPRSAVKEGSRSPRSEVLATPKESKRTEAAVTDETAADESAMVADGDENGAEDGAAGATVAAPASQRRGGGKGSRGGGGSRWTQNRNSTSTINLAAAGESEPRSYKERDSSRYADSVSLKVAEPRIHPYVKAVQNINSVRDQFALKNIFSRDADRMRAVNAVYYMSELQRSANEFVPARDHSDLSIFNHRLLLQQHLPNVIAEQLLLPPTHDINQAVDLLDQHVDVLYNCLKSIREKQFMSEGTTHLFKVDTSH